MPGCGADVLLGVSRSPLDKHAPELSGGRRTELTESP